MAPGPATSPRCRCSFWLIHEVEDSAVACFAMRFRSGVLTTSPVEISMLPVGRLVQRHAKFAQNSAASLSSILFWRLIIATK